MTNLLDAAIDRTGKNREENVVNTVLVTFATVLVIGASLALGVVLGYAAIVGILNFFGRRRSGAKTAPVALVPQVGPTGD